MNSLNQLTSIINIQKKISLLFICILFSVASEAAYYNLGAMIQGPKLVFTQQPANNASVGSAFPVQPIVSVVKPNGSIIAAATDTITLTAYSDSLCSIASGGSLSASPIAAVSGVATFSSVSYSQTGKIYIKATAPGKKSVCSSAVIITQPIIAGPDPSQFKLAFLGPSSIDTNNCTAYTVVLQDKFGGSVAAPSTINLKLAGVGTGSFYSNSGCSSAITTSSIATNSNQVTVYYKSPTPETNTLQASDQNSQVVDASLNLNVTAYKLQLNGPTTVNAGSACYTYNVSYLTAAGANAGVITVDISGFLGNIFSDSGCGTSITASPSVTTSGSGTVSFYLKGPTINPGTPFTITISSPGAASAALDVGVITGSAPTKLVITGSTSPITNNCTSYLVGTQDGSSTYQPVSSDTTITLSGNAGGAWYSDDSCKTAVSSFVLKAGSSKRNLYFKDSTAESTTLTASASGLTPGNLSVTSVATGSSSPMVAAGNSHTCALLADQTVKCWGDNTSGQLGNGTFTSSLTPVLVANLNGVTAIASGNNFTCALLNSTYSKGVRCWGKGQNYKLGNGSNSDSNVPVSVSSLTNIEAISAGNEHACAVAGGWTTVYCWGLGTDGQIGNNGIATAMTPTLTNSIGGTINAIASGANHTCVALSPSGTVKCWGDGGFGQIGNGGSSDALVPTAVNTISGGATAVSANNGTSCAIVSGTVKCWGSNSVGQLGDSTNNNSNIPVSTNITNAVEISGKDNHTCARLTDQSVKCWGNNSYGELGINSMTNVNTPTNVIGLTMAIAIGSGANHTCAVLSDKTIQCWGKNHDGQLGNGYGNWNGINYTILTPTLVPSVTNVDAVAAGSSHTCFLQNQIVKCFGFNQNGQLGNNSTVTSFNPVQVSSITNAVAISSGNSYSCALLSTGQINCWGANGFGQLGDGTTDQSLTPVTVNGINNAIAIATSSGLGASHACAILADRTVKCWGANGFGQLGNGTTATPITTPVTVDGINNAIAISLGGLHSCALLSDQSVKCWGLASLAQLGNGAGGNSPTPASVPGISSAIAISTSGGANHTCVIMSNQTVKCWGSNSKGQIGNNSLATALNAVDVFGINSASKLTVGDLSSCALLTDKSMRCWGSNSSGQLGNGSTSSSLIPTAVLNNSTIASISAFGSNICVLLTDKRIMCNGANPYIVNTTIPNFVIGIPQ